MRALPQMGYIRKQNGKVKTAASKESTGTPAEG